MPYKRNGYGTVLSFLVNLTWILRSTAKLVATGMGAATFANVQDNIYVHWVRFFSRRNKYSHVSLNSLLFFVAAKKYFDGLFARSTSSFSLVSHHRWESRNAPETIILFQHSSCRVAANKMNRVSSFWGYRLIWFHAPLRVWFQ